MPNFLYFYKDPKLYSISGLSATEPGLTTSIPIEQTHNFGFAQREIQPVPGGQDKRFSETWSLGAYGGEHSIGSNSHRALLLLDRQESTCRWPSS